MFRTTMSHTILTSTASPSCRLAKEGSLARTCVAGPTHCWEAGRFREFDAGLRVCLLQSATAFNFQLTGNSRAMPPRLVPFRACKLLVVLMDRISLLILWQHSPRFLPRDQGEPVDATSSAAMATLASTLDSRRVGRCRTTKSTACSFAGK